jgi:ribosomal protein S27E
LTRKERREDMDRISDEELERITTMYCHNDSVLYALVELRERRQAQKVTIPEPYDADWTSLECPKCHHTNVCLDKFGYRCFTSGCGWTKDDPVLNDAATGREKH